MKLNRTYVFIGISSVALLALLILQVNWIMQTAQIKEEFFSEKANMVLTKTAGSLALSKEACRKIESTIKVDSASELSAKLSEDEAHKIDSLLSYYMRIYNFHIEYSFKVVKPNPFISKNVFALSNLEAIDKTVCFKKGLEEVANENGLELILILPDKKQFIMAEMGTMFVTSVILILIVLVMFWRTVLSLLKEKKISEHTADFLNNMTHEFKTPLTNIALAGKMIIKDSTIKQEDKIKHYSGIILEENEKLRLQVEQVLSMTALERGEIPLYKTELDFHQLINDCLKQISIQIENKQGELNLMLDAESFMVNGDKVHLANALCNLIDNAIKYSGEKPDLLIQTYNNTQNLIISITDKGIGIEKEYHKKVFDKYFRVPTGDVHNVKGFGLGLAYIKKIIELHKGTIELESEKEKGTTFTITLAHV